MKKVRKSPVKRVCAGCGEVFGFIGRHHTVGPCKGKGWSKEAPVLLSTAPASPKQLGEAVISSAAPSGAERQYVTTRQLLNKIKKKAARVSRRKDAYKSSLSIKQTIDKIRAGMNSHEYDGFKFCPYCSTMIDTYLDGNEESMPWCWCACCGRALSKLYAVSAAP